jgi:hypothetical protein
MQAGLVLSGCEKESCAQQRQLDDVVNVTANPAFKIIRASAAAVQVPSVHKPSLYVALQGAAA